ncbi:MAG: MoxR family ATPase [Deltaproteobacteria bacterium]|nr:MoxR family ATPase [Deltaproteobacteria bacterium]
MTPSDAAALLERLRGNLERVIRGKRDPLELLLCCVAGGGHVLLEDIPGTGKTTLARALAQSMGCSFKRIQFTPDLLPSDILGASIYNPQTGAFTFKPGPVFAHVIIADEINRASPRTQSSLLEALSEQQVTVEGDTRVLPSPFLCIATQNPIDFHGTYPLPEAQLDRFAMMLGLGYPPADEERAILQSHVGGPPLADLKALTDGETVVRLQHSVEGVKLEETVADYLMRLVHATRNHPSIRLGVSMRGALLLGRLSRARALSQARGYVLPDDVKRLAEPVLAHRLILDTKARYAGLDKRGVLRDVLASVPVPR